MLRCDGKDTQASLAYPGAPTQRTHWSQGALQDLAAREGERKLKAEKQSLAQEAEIYYPTSRNVNSCDCDTGSSS